MLSCRAAAAAAAAAAAGRKPFTRLVGQCQDILLRNKSVYDDINSKLLVTTSPSPCLADPRIAAALVPA